MQKKRIFLPAVLAVWGVAIVIYGLVGGSSAHTSGAYHGGQMAALVMGVVMAVAGTVAVVRAVRQRG
jgi:hypothetical protein